MSCIPEDVSIYDALVELIDDSDLLEVVAVLDTLIATPEGRRVQLVGVDGQLEYPIGR